MERTALIMAGGRGERFWPYSRQDLPKQFISLTADGKTMIQLTVERILPMVKMENIYISTNSAYRQLVYDQLPEVPKENILCEPVARNTAPCIGFGAIHIAKKHGDAIMIVLPSDHLIKYDGIFLNTLELACDVALNGKNLVTIGITPDHPETGYGYIQFDTSFEINQAFRVERFVEKPDLETAKRYVASSEYLWNSGMFVWKVSSILDNIAFFMPETYQGLLAIQASIGTTEQDSILSATFASMSSVSIDYGVMEKAKDIFIIPGSFGWDDVGSWLAMERIHETNEHGNVIFGDFMTLDTKNCVLQGGDKFVAIVGVKDLIVVDAKDALLICAKDSTGGIKQILENLRARNRNALL